MIISVLSSISACAVKSENSALDSFALKNYGWLRIGDSLSEVKERLGENVWTRDIYNLNEKVYTAHVYEKTDQISNSEYTLCLSEKNDYIGRVSLTIRKDTHSTTFSLEEKGWTVEADIDKALLSSSSMKDKMLNIWAGSDIVYIAYKLNHEFRINQNSSITQHYSFSIFDIDTTYQLTFESMLGFVDRGQLDIKKDGSIIESYSLVDKEGFKQVSVKNN